MAHRILIPALATILVALLFLSPPTAANSPVLDIDGNPLEVGSQYYVLTSGTRGAGRGGLTFASRPSQLCPQYVAQHGWWTEKGRSVSFYPADSSQKKITLGDDVNIVSGRPNYCRDRGVWKLTFDNETSVPYVATNGVIGNPGAETSASWFKIEETVGGGSFKFLYCFADINMIGSIDEKFYQLDATQRGPQDLTFLSLVPLDQPLPFFGFVFKKVTTTAYY